MSDNAVVDFETEAIDKRPNYPPRPVGVAVKLPGERKGKYYAWGHPTGNNCTMGEARDRVRAAYDAKRVLFHHGGFDIDVAECFMGIAPPRRYEDTTFLAFLNDPYERTLQLKPLSEKHLDMPPEEQALLRDWVLNNVKVGNRKVPKTKWGEHIAKAPGELVGAYAVGDLTRTEGMYEHLMPIIDRRGMREAYERELLVLPISLEMERSGIRVHRRRLRELQDALEKLDSHLLHSIQRKLGVIRKGQPLSKEFNVDSGAQLAKALVKAGKLDAIIKTPTGKVSTKITNLRATCNDKELLDLLAVHSVVEKYLSSFVRPWLLQSAVTGGRVLPKFNQTRNDGGGGARSGRFSSSDPNLQNIPTNPEESQNKDTLLLLQKMLLDRGYEFRGLRDYIIPDEGSVMICTDYNQQELRILAHFEEDMLMEAYLQNPKLDVHDFFRLEILKATGIDFPRKHVKVTVFGIIYGMGTAKLAARLGISPIVAQQLRKALFKVCPGITRIIRELKILASQDKPLVTWGGREYFCEPPRWMPYDNAEDPELDGEWVGFEYKMFNYKIQPSAADMTKQGMINVSEQVPEVRIAVQVHDELVTMAPDESYGPKVADAMCDVELNVPMLADPKYSRSSWARAK